MIDDGLAQAGIAPTTQDTTDKYADTVPVSLRADQLHVNAAANRVVARKVVELLIERVWALLVALRPLKAGGSTADRS
ncbi:hypothetical protein [Rhodococcoides fascians]|uniref:hypothetical protein n=1 Tax=Rhodococcoides fascians TaxID=1828 RepID=UPI00366EAE24